jgi:hypothetical protein
MFKPEEAWNIIKRNAEKAMQVNAIWCSLVEISPYKLLEITNDYLLIQRVNGGEDQKLTKSKVIKSAEKLVLEGGKISVELLSLLLLRRKLRLYSFIRN